MEKNMTYYYLSQPYNGTDEQKKYRFEMGATVCLNFLKKQIAVFSPIVHNHTLMIMAQDFTVEERRNTFMPFDFAMLGQSRGMLLLKLEGWEQSYGVKLEIEYCQQHQIPIHYLELDEVLTEVMSFP